MDNNFTPEELAAWKNEYAANATQDQFNLWMAECRRRNLRPVADIIMQVRASQEWDPELRAKVSRKRCIFITGYHALRKIAERTNLYAGQQPSVFIYLDSAGLPTIKSDVPLPDPKDHTEAIEPWAVCASILRKDFQEPMRFVARFWAYAQTFNKDGKSQLTSMWAQRGPEQLEKCAIAGALRAAFPEELSGLEVYEEQRREETELPPPEPVTPPPSVAAPVVDHAPAEPTDAPRPDEQKTERQQLIARLREWGQLIGKDELKKKVMEAAGSSDTKNLSNEQLRAALNSLEAESAHAAA